MKLIRISLLTAVLVLSVKASQAQHINAGAVGHNLNDQLVWANGAEFAADSGYVQIMSLATSGRYQGLYNSGPTFTALESDMGGAAPGAFLTAEIVSVAGPLGGIFSFWEGLDQGGGSSPMFSIATGGTGLSHQFALSDVSTGAGQPDQDPHGHLHGRRFTANELGVYTVGFRVLDTSMNGLQNFPDGGGPIHAPSEVLFVNFAAVPEPSVFALAGLGLAGLWILRRNRNV